jgi:membrane fusion protein (multidrug efflux system)
MIVCSCTAIVLVVAGFSVLKWIERSRGAAAKTTVTSTATPVQITHIQRRPQAIQVDFRGFLEPFTELTIAAKVPGIIVEQWVEVSDEVDVGDSLFKTDDAVTKLVHEKALAMQKRAESDHGLAQANWRRVQDLTRGTSTSIERVESEAGYHGASADKHQADVAVREAALQLEWTIVRSPLDGVVSKVHLRMGEYARAGQPLVDLIEVDRLKLLTEMEDRDVVQIKVGMQAKLSSAAFPDEQFLGTITRIFPKALPTSRKFEVEFELPNPGRRLRPGFFLTGSITQFSGSDEVANILVIPRLAVIERYGQHCCYLVQAIQGEGETQPVHRAVRRVIEVWPLRSDPSSFRLVAGLVEGDTVVTKGQQYLTDRAEVHITN